MTEPNALALIYHRPQADGGLRIRLALFGLAHEAFPDADDMLVVVDAELDWSAVRHQGSPPWVRHSILGRTYDQRLRLGRLVASTWPDASRAHAVFYRSERIIGVMELPLTP